MHVLQLLDVQHQSSFAVSQWDKSKANITKET
jgi:hypothetical protein